MALDSMIVRKVPRNDSQIAEQKTALNSDAVGLAEDGSGNDDAYNSTESVAAKKINKIQESTEREKNEKSVDRAAVRTVNSRIRKLEKKAWIGIFVEEEASESEDEENMGVVNTVEDMMKRKQNDLLDEKLDKMTKDDVLKAYLEGIVDAPQMTKAMKMQMRKAFMPKKCKRMMISRLRQSLKIFKKVGLGRDVVGVVGAI